MKKIVETLRPPPEGGAHLGHVFRGQRLTQTPRLEKERLFRSRDAAGGFELRRDNARWRLSAS